MALFESGRNRRRIIQIAWIAAFWTLVGMLDAFNTHALADSTYLMQTHFYDFIRYLRVSVLAAFTSGIVCGVVFLFFLRDRFRTKTFGFALLINSIAISALCSAFSTVAYAIFLSLRYQEQILSDRVLTETRQWLASGLYIKNLVLWTIVAFITIIFINVNDKYGPGIFGKLLLGRYHRPREEERIFMFADIRGSTQIAEKLGHIRFFNLLNDFYRIITNPVIDTSGEIYQYVGDEVVLSWTMERGLHQGNCIRCFYQMQEALQHYAPRLRDKYGIVPEFKVGLHAGMVTIGEIGVIKKDIVFSGDVLNTTSRIQNLCNTYQVNILISKSLLDRLHLPPHGYRPHRVGLIQLRGKQLRMELYTFLREDEKLPVRPPIAST
ncbi:MAG: adenylate/guanylate cyclase domain-containing protein [Saprospiraceae bacterium]|nr:adenylate/guanylate cyclase domain-containing protein [Lewinella sp.]